MAPMGSDCEKGRALDFVPRRLVAADAALLSGVGRVGLSIATGRGRFGNGLAKAPNDARPSLWRCFRVDWRRESTRLVLYSFGVLAEEGERSVEGTGARGVVEPTSS